MISALLLSLMVTWTDGDSGSIVLENGDKVKFRLADTDAPESRSQRSRYGAARCEAERRLGLTAKLTVRALTDNGDVAMTSIRQVDRYGRWVVRLSVNGVDLAEEMQRRGLHGSWRHDERNRSLERKPDWCAILGDQP